MNLSTFSHYVSGISVYITAKILETNSKKGGESHF